MNINLSAAFKKLNAKPENIRYSVSAFAADGSLVLSLWEHYFRQTEEGVLAYFDRLSRWSGRGNALLDEHIRKALAGKVPIRAIVAHTQDRHVIDLGGDGSKVKKEFHIMEPHVGNLVEFDGDNFVIHFHKPAM
jgi:hypothetical protein